MSLPANRVRDGRARVLACAVIAAALLLAALIAGCGGSGGGGTRASSRVSAQFHRALAYSDCMRSHRVPDFPDPDGQGGFVIGPAPDLDPNSPAFQAGLKACGPLPSSVTPAQEDQAFHRALKAAVCMRANGVADYPEPQLVKGQGTSGKDIAMSFNGLNLDAPAFQTAMKKCGYQDERQLIGVQPAGG